VSALNSSQSFAMRHASRFCGISAFRRLERSFTLLEVLITIALLAGLVFSLLAFGFDMLSSRQQALQSAWRQRAAAALIDRLERDLAASVTAMRSESGIIGGETSLSILTRGVAASFAERSADDADIFGDLQRTEYRFNQSAHTVEVRRTPWGSTLSNEAVFASIGGEVGRLGFRYHDGQTWQTSFDSSAAGQLPRALEVIVWYAPAEAADEAEHVADEIDTSAFDESAFAERSDRHQSHETPADRRRVIVIPDWHAGDQIAAHESRDAAAQNEVNQP
jgi:type II secretory pathway component PulJ